MNTNKLTRQLEEVANIYKKKFGVTDTKHFFILKLQEEMGELTQSYLRMSGMAKTKGKTTEQLRHAFQEEIADVICMTLLLAKQHDIEVENAIEKKWLKWLKK